jgi:hypothetical protein
MKQQFVITHTIGQAHETAICHNPHNRSGLVSCITKQFGYKHTFCQNALTTLKEEEEEEEKILTYWFMKVLLPHFPVL